MRKLLALLSVVLLSVCVASAQSRTITGKVVDETGSPVEGATVQIKGSSTGVAADASGNFRLSANTGDVLVISATNFTPVEVTVGSENTISVTLNRAATVIDEVVVVALGQQRQAKELGYSTAKVKSAELIAARPTNLQNGLTAKVSGLNVLTTNNGVFASTRLTLRGIRSLTGNNQPMLVVDGTPMSLGFLSSINPNDVADVTVLKSSSATVVYGPEGVNGAIVVTTKKGSRTRPIITVSNSLQFESISYMPEFQTRFGSGYSADQFGYGIYDPVEQQSWGPEFDGSIVQIGEADPDGNIMEVPYSYIKNNRKNFFDVGTTNQTDVSFSTGDFYVSAQNVMIRGVMPGDENNRRTFTFKAEKEYNKFKAGFNLRYTNTSYDVTTNNTLIYYDVTGAPGHIDISKFSDWRNDYFSSPDGYYTTFLGNNGKTPYFAKDNYREEGSIDDIFGNMELNLRATSWMNFTYRLGATVSSADAHRTRGAFTHSAFHHTRHYPSDVNVTAAVNDANTYANRLTSELFARFNKKVNNFGFNLLVGHSFREIENRFLSVGSDNLGQSTLYSVTARKGEPAVDVDNSKQKLQRFFGVLGIDYNGWAFLEATGSYDADSRLAPANGDFKMSDIAFFYPGVSASVLLHEAVPALNNSKLISYFKVRGAYSKTGNVPFAPYAGEAVWNPGLFFPFNDILGYQAPGGTVQPTYQPEFVVNKEVGVELGFLNNRINLELVYYNQDNSDQVVNVQYSNTSGYTSALLNAASFTNSGVEVDLKLTPLVRIKDVNIDFKINYSYLDNEVTKIVEGVDELGIGNFNYAIVGQPVYVFKLTDYIRDDAGHVIVDPITGMPSLNPNLTTFGRTSPNHILGLNLGVTWKNLSFSATADYRAGNQIVADQLGGFLDDNGISARSAQNGRRPFVWPNSVYWDGSKYVQNTDIYTQTYGREFWNSELNTDAITNYLANGSFWKLREAAINYTFNPRIFPGDVVKGLTVGVFGRNLLMWLPESNQWTDPEYSANGNNAYTGNATGRSTAYNMPPTRFYGFNVVFTF